MHNEEEAKKKWCPIRAKINAMNDTGAIGPVEDEDQPDNCLGSGCIEWQSLSVISILNAIPYTDKDSAAIIRFRVKAKEMVNEGVFKSVGRCGVRNA